MRRSLLFMVMAMLAVADKVHSQDSASTATQARPASPLIRGQIGLGIVTVPRYLGSDERFVLPVPILDLRIAKRVYLGGAVTGVSFGTGVYLVETPHFAWTADLTLTPNRPEDRADALAGMGDRGFGVFAGTSLYYRTGPFQAVASVAVGLEKKMGVTTTLGASLGQPLGRRWYGRVDAITVIASCNAMAWDFEVTPEQAARRAQLVEQGAPGLGPADTVPYTPECGLRDARLSGTLVYLLSPRWSIIGSATAFRLFGGAADSPLTRTKTGWETVAGLAWRF